MKKTFIITIAVILALILMSGYSASVNSNLSDNMVRLHVLANSNSNEDQQLKLKVRDAILLHSRNEFTKKDQVKSQLDIYKQIAEKVIRENGFDYDVNVEYGNFNFPTKKYNNLRIPAGNYDAVRVKIGNAEGKNWWCVMFPPLCFVNGTTDATHATEELRSTLKRDSYDIITAHTQGGSLPFEIKFKIVELFGRFGNNKVYAKTN